MTSDISLDGRTFAPVVAEDGDVGEGTRFEYEQTGDRVYAHYAGGAVADGHLVGTFDGRRLDIRYAQITESGATATGHSVGEVTLLDDGRVRIEDEWSWESKPGRGETVLEEVVGEE